jgi:hypothetical protein
MDSTVAVQTNGFGSLFHAVRYASMGAFRSSTLRKTPPDRLLIHLAEPTLDQIQPTGTCGDKVEDEARVTLQPVPDILVLVSSIVVHDKMERDFTRELLVQDA